MHSAVLSNGTILHTAIQATQAIPDGLIFFRATPQYEDFKTGKDRFGSSMTIRFKRRCLNKFSSSK
jgi:hypothetical protein